MKREWVGGSENEKTEYEGRNMKEERKKKKDGRGYEEGREPERL